MLGRKLKSRRGMSILMGLLLLLVCATAGAAALTSAASNAGRYTHMRQDQQRYLAVSSAAQLVRDKLCAGEYTASADLTETYTRVKHGPNAEGKYTWSIRGPEYAVRPLVSSSCTGELSSWLKDHMDAVSGGEVAASDWWSLAGASKPSSPGKEEYTGLAVQVEGEDPILSQVKWTLTLGEDYGMVATFWLEEDGNRYYTTTLTIPAKVAVEEKLDTPTTLKTVTTRTQTVTWPAQGAVIRQS